MREETIEEFLARGGIIKRSEKILGLAKLRREYGANLSAKIGKIIDTSGRKRNGSIGNCNEALQTPHQKGVGHNQSCHPAWLQ